MDDDIRKEFELIRNVMDQNTRTLIKNENSLLDGQKKMQLCIDGITKDVKDIKERTSKIEYQLTHFVK